MKPSIWLASLSWLLFFHSARGCGQQPTSDVTIHVVDEYGVILGPVKVNHFVLGTDGVDLASKFVNGAATGIPYGRYRATVQAAPVGTLQWIDIRRPKAFVVLCGRRVIMDFPPGESVRLAGKITGLPANVVGPVWVEVVEIHGGVPPWTEVSRLEDDGFFGVSVPGLGEYLLVILHGGGVISCRPVRVDRVNTSIAIDLKAKDVN